MHEKLCEFLKEHVMKMINFKKKKIKLWTKEQQESYGNVNVCYICKETFQNKSLKEKKYCKVRDHCYYTGEYWGAAHFIRNLKYSVPKKISILFHNGSNYDYHFMIIELAEEFKKQFTCLWEHTQKYVTFTVPIEKKATHYQILSIVFLKEFIELNVNSDTIIKNVKYVELNISIATVTLNTKILKMI